MYTTAIDKIETSYNIKKYTVRILRSHRQTMHFEEEKDWRERASGFLTCHTRSHEVLFFLDLPVKNKKKSRGNNRKKKKYDVERRSKPESFFSFWVYIMWEKKPNKRPTIHTYEAKVYEACDGRTTRTAQTFEFIFYFFFYLHRVVFPLYNILFFITISLGCYIVTCAARVIFSHMTMCLFFLPFNFFLLLLFLLLRYFGGAASSARKGQSGCAPTQNLRLKNKSKKSRFTKDRVSGWSRLRWIVCNYFGNKSLRWLSCTMLVRQWKQPSSMILVITCYDITDLAKTKCQLFDSMIKEIFVQMKTKQTKNYSTAVCDGLGN